MAFRLAQSETFSAPVEVEMRSESGKWEKSTFSAVYRRATIDELDELRALPHREVLERQLVSWTGVQDEHGQDVPYTPETRAAMFVIPAALAGLASAFWSSHVRAREKN